MRMFSPSGDLSSKLVSVAQQNASAVLRSRHISPVSVGIDVWLILSRANTSCTCRIVLLVYARKFAMQVF